MQIRALMPPHPSPNFTLEQAVAAWLKVEARERQRRRRGAPRRVMRLFGHPAGPEG